MFGIAFLVQAALILWRGFARADSSFRETNGPWHPLGVVLAFYAVAYPMLGYSSDFSIRGSPPLESRVPRPF
jgi:hypothetical protein